ncbi:MAG: tetratricopeptide repeat protein [Myxococcales bacterium]|nr:tetratricopeptide repeat protein [Myxococcales bacterium]
MRTTILLSALLLGSPALAGDGSAHDDAVALWKAGDLPGAVKAFKAITRSDGEDAKAWYLLGTVELQRGKLKRSVAALQTALDKGWYATVGAYNLACAHARAGNADAAFTALDQALSAGYANPEHMAEDADLANLRDLDGWQARLDQADLNKRPCMHDEAYRAFDFWVGDWNVYDAAGTQVGTNTVSSLENGCVIEERWTSVLGSTGRSYSYLDPTDGQWHQDWVASGGAVVHYTGGLDDAGAMSLTGTRATPKSPSTATRCIWATAEGGSVTQTFQGQNDDGSWKTKSVLTYRPDTETAKADSDG